MALIKKEKCPVFWSKEWEVSSCHTSEEISVFMSSPHSSDEQRLAEPGEKSPGLQPQVEPIDVVGTCTGEAVHEAPV